jgi:hypothetical protein
MIITPTIGRVVWFTPVANDAYVKNYGDQPMAALVTYVFSDRMVNLVVFDHEGNARPHTSVDLVQEGDPKPEERYAEWMPYQVGQAKKHAVEVPAELPNFREEGTDGV